MAFKLLAVTGLMVGSAMAGAVPKTPYKFSCGAPPPGDNLKAVSKQFAIEEANLNSLSQVNAASINVDTYIHVVSVDRTAGGGYLSRETVDAQMRVLNDNFAPSGFSFTLKDVDWTVNANWARNRNSLAMKRQLRKGSYAALNLYYQTDEDAIRQAFSKTNEGYAPAGITHTLDGVDYTKNQAWAFGADEMGMKAKLRKGGYSDLNVYFVAQIGAPGVLGPIEGCPAQNPPHSCGLREPDPIYNFMSYTNALAVALGSNAAKADKVTQTKVQIQWRALTKAQQLLQVVPVVPRVPRVQAVRVALSVQAVPVVLGALWFPQVQAVRVALSVQAVPVVLGALWFPRVQAVPVALSVQAVPVALSVQAILVALWAARESTQMVLSFPSPKTVRSFR
ncbi:DNA replication complex GINS protein psf2 [Purpureocillium lavendulum]|uniref:DNA replication complex GINS protein psf2 n=1 Tax=Purpureocillium lavendulum TaxID=1247861 RepID=A0AB34GAL0_9HYPO|nr:DNA replication complex GINS protein psf2 [Purpureocillium lavendulum]